MPLCTHPLHAGSGLPPVQPVAQFYTRRTTGVLLPYCRHCRRVEMRLRHRQPRGPWDAALRQATWQAYWQLRRRKTPAQAPPTGLRWCPSPQPHFALAAQFVHTYDPRLCLDCARIQAMRWTWRKRHGVELSWAQVAQRYRREAHRRTTRRRNAAARPGERWCTRCQAYYRVPATWRRQRPVLCPAHTAEYLRHYYHAVRKVRRRGRTGKGGTNDGNGIDNADGYAYGCDADNADGSATPGVLWRVWRTPSWASAAAETHTPAGSGRAASAAATRGHVSTTLDAGDRGYRDADATFPRRPGD